MEFGKAKLRREPKARTNSGIGIFIARDPFAGIARSPRSFNPYMYANNNPLLYTDPSGEFAQIFAAAALGAVIGGIGGAAFGRLTYTAAIAGNCGCDMWQGAVDAGSEGNWVSMLSQYGALIGAVGGAIAASGPIGMIYVGMFGLTASSVDLLRTTYSIYADGLTVCKAVRFMADVIGMATSAAAIQAGLTEIYAPVASSIPEPETLQLVRDPKDIEWQNKYPTPPKSKTTGSISKSVPQNTQVDELISLLENLGATDIRKNQQQVNIGETCVGINKPDLQFTYNNRRWYFEWDRASSSRGPGHAYRIQANDPSATGVLPINANSAPINLFDLLNGILHGDNRIILITLD